VIDLPRIHTIRESSLRILNPFSAAKVATLGEAVGLAAGITVLDLCCGKGEALSTWARDHGITGTGVDVSTIFLAAARERATELDVADRVTFVHADASDYVAETPVDVAACIGATWIGDGVDGTVALLARSLRPGGTMLIGEPYWRSEPPHQEAVEACHASARSDYDTLPELVERFGRLGYDVVEMVLADPDSWDRYVASRWRNIRLFVDAHPDDELAPRFRAELDNDPRNYVRYRRDLMGWGVFALMSR